MLELKNITKTYNSGEESVQALKEINIAFRESEFVSVLGQSGCGKTTLLNIIGGLDDYTSGDLIINGKSTKEYKDRDWDTYRNHSVGFVFQSYNLIPHQNVLSNVELALTISGVSRHERRKRAKDALEQVGLGDQIRKMPNQLSGGQMQRVAIARALVNNPDIILADEPTGALDSETSVQVMEILKEVSKDRLVIMVTHNPDLAEKYSTRIVRILDGEIISDSMPYDPEAGQEKSALALKKPSMSFWTALSLSLNNLRTKKGRTILTAFAGSIGIIGIALILSLSTGMQNFINDMEEDTLTSYPITISESTADMSSMMSAMMSINDTVEYDDDLVHSNSIMTGLISSVVQDIHTNDLTSFKEYLKEDGNEIAELCTEISYTYDTEVGIYTTRDDGSVLQVNPVSYLTEIGLGDIMDSVSMMMDVSVAEELLDSEDMREDTYSLLYGDWPSAYNEIAIVVTPNNELTDYTLYAFGLLDTAELADGVSEVLDAFAGTGEFPEDFNIDSEDVAYTYDELMDLDFKLVLPTDKYVLQDDGTWKDMSDDEAYMSTLVDNAESLHITGIIQSNSGSTMTEYGKIAYTSDLTEYVVSQIEGSDIVRAQKDTPDIDVLNGLPFSDTEEAEAILAEMENDNASGMTEEQEALVLETVAALPEMYQNQLESMTTEEQAEMLISYGMLDQAAYDSLGSGGEEEEEVQFISDSTYNENMLLFHTTSLDEPTSIDLYVGSFEDKEVLTDALDAYNDTQKDAGEEDKVIEYTDYVGLLMSSVTQIVNIVSYVLIAFVAISLIVSSIMIGVITLISVQERTKEIGILRAIGAAKRDISRVFNAETLIIGLAAGLIGIIITLLLDIPINALINRLAGIENIAHLPAGSAVILVLISVALTIIAGLIPSRKASKKDPVEALRTE